MIKTTSKLIIASLAVMLFSCNQQNEDITNAVNKTGAIETAVHVTHLDTLHDELTTTHKIWVKNNVFKTVEYRDTIPALGTETTEAENEDGDTKKVSVKKDYEIYITVK